MSKAFTKDDGAGDEPIVPPRPPLPAGVPNYVTRRGLRLLQEEAQALDRERQAGAEERRRLAGAFAARAAALSDRLATASLVEPEPGAGVVRFGTVARVRTPDGRELRYRIVGVDEADPARGDLAFTSPIARALLGKEPGDEVIVRTPSGEQVLELAAVEADSET